MRRLQVICRLNLEVVLEAVLGVVLPCVFDRPGGLLSHIAPVPSSQDDQFSHRTTGGPQRYAEVHGNSVVWIYAISKNRKLTGVTA